MPYLPTNYFPKNCAISVENNVDPIGIYCLIDNYDIIDKAIVRIYNYITKAPIVTIYADKYGKIFNTELNNNTTDLSYQDFLEWKNRTSASENTTEWTIDENPLPIKGGSTEKSILYITLEDNLLLTNKKYIWDIQIFSKEKNVWIVDGYLDGDWKETDNTIKIYPNDNIDIDGKFETEKGVFNIIDIKNKYFEIETTARVSTKTNNTSPYTHSIELSHSIDFPDNKDDLKIQIDVYTYDLFFSNPEGGYKSKLDGYVVLNGNSGIVYSDNILTETESSNSYVLIYRQYQTIQLDKSTDDLSENDFYTIYSDSIRSTSNYFTTIVEPEVKLTSYGCLDKNTYKLGILKEDGSFISEDDEQLILKNVYHQFFGESNDYPISWYQWTISDAFGKIYQSEKQYTSDIYLEYERFFDSFYTLTLTIEYQNGYQKTINYSLNIENEKEQSITSNPELDMKRKAVKINYDNLNTYTPSINKEGQWYSEYKKDGLTINDGYSVEYSVLGSNQLSLNMNADWEFTCSFDEFFYGNILELNIDNQIHRLWYKGEEDSFYWDDTHLVTWTVGKKTGLFTTSSSPDMSGDLYSYIVGQNETASVTGFNFLDFLSKIILQVRYTKNNGRIQFIYFKKEDKESPIRVSSKSLGELGTDLNSIKLYGNITWYNIKFYEGSRTDSRTQFYLDFTTDELRLNAGNVESPEGFKIDSYLIFRDNLEKEKEIVDYNYIARIYLQDEYINDKKVKGVYDYGVGCNNTYSYTIIPIYKNENDIHIAGPAIMSTPITTDWFEISLFGVENNEDSNVYRLDTNEKWYFELDANGNNITFNSDREIYSLNTKIPKVGHSNKDYLSSSITCKLGQIKNEWEYVQDNIKYLYKFNKFANSNKIKILRLKNGMIIPVDIKLKSSNFYDSLVATPSDINFDWTQIADYHNVSLYELLIEENEVNE